MEQQVTLILDILVEDLDLVQSHSSVELNTVMILQQFLEDHWSAAKYSPACLVVMQTLVGLGGFSSPTTFSTIERLDYSNDSTTNT